MHRALPPCAPIAAAGRGGRHEHAYLRPHHGRSGLEAAPDIDAAGDDRPRLDGPGSGGVAGASGGLGDGDWGGPGWTDDALTDRFRVVQRRRGHRYSLDDVLTACVAARSGPRPARALDLGCGLGSVLLMVAHAAPEARLVGVEAQPISFRQAEHNVRRNGLSSRIRLHHADLREPELGERVGRDFDLITGTPPYAPVGTCTPSPDPQRAHARVELRGGVEAYLRAAAPLLGATGRLVLCADARRPERVLGSAPALGLRPLRRLDCVPREGKPALFTVWVLERAAAPGATRACSVERFVARDGDGRRTEAYLELRAFFGLSGGAR